MKFNKIIFLYLFFILVSCQDKKTSQKKTETQTYSGCIGDHYFLPGCPGYNENSSPSTTDGTTGGSTGISYPTTNPYPQLLSTPVTQNWGVKYPGGVPTESCSQTYSPSEIDFTPYDTRKATMTIVGRAWYSPTDSSAPFYMNTSSLLKSLTGARQLFSTDSLLKVRFKALPQPESSESSPHCFGRQPGVPIAGYTQLKFTVVIGGLMADGTSSTEPLGTYTIDVNSCTPAIDLSSYVSRYPGGIHLVVQSVKGNQGSWPHNYSSYGFRDSTMFSDIRSSDCWALDVEVAADGTKTFD